jgi:hypothetical protein
MRAGFRILLITAIFLTAWLVPVKDAIACDCAWMGPFLTVGPRSSLVVRGRVIGYYGKGKESPPAMDLEVLEAFCGENPKSPLRVWGDNGMLCRPYVTLFPVGTEWIFALDGPGSKPDMSSGHAISICGEFWLRVEGEKVKGNIDRPDDRGAVRAIPLAEFRKLFAAEVARGGAPKRASAASAPT